MTWTDEKTEITFLLRGFDMSKVTDDAKFILQYPVVVQATYGYTAVGGAQTTVLVLERNDGKIKEILESKRKDESRRAEEKLRAANERVRVEKARRDAEEAARWRTWTDAAGTHTIEARYGGVVLGKVKLTKKDGTTIQVPIEKLSDEDQQWIKKRSR